MVTLDRNTVNRYLTHKQHLTEKSKTDNILQIAGDILGLHATGPTTPFLSLLARTNHFHKELLTEELYENKALAKIKCFRRTIFILPEDLVPIAFAASKSLSSLTSSQFDRHLGMPHVDYEKTADTIVNILKGRRLTASELKKELSQVESLTHIINYMCDQGILVRGMSKTGWKSNLNYYHLFHDLYPNIDLETYKESEAIEILIKLYLESYGPVTLTDIVWWSGLKTTVIRRHLEILGDWIEHINISGLEGDFLIARDDLAKLTSFTPPKEDTVNLLPFLDPYIMGYKDRDRYLDSDKYHKVFDRSGNGTSTIILNGGIIGVWDTSAIKESMLRIHLFEDNKKSVIMDQIYEKAEQMGRFLIEGDVQVRICNAMIPLNERTAGGFMTPLRYSDSRLFKH